MLSAHDREATEFLRVHYGLNSESQAIRVCALYQVRRDLERRTEEAELAYKVRMTVIRETCVEMLRKSLSNGRGEYGLRPMAIWRKPDVMANLEAIMKAWCFNRRAEAVRFAIRSQAEIDGFTPQGGW